MYFFPSRILGYYAIGALFCTLTTELAKYNVGRLRPYFLTVCQPDLSKEACLDAYGYQKFVTNYTCHNADVKMVREARKSFLSGHSSFSFYCATFIIMYLYVPTTQLLKCIKIYDQMYSVIFRHARLSSDARQDMNRKRYDFTKICWQQFFSFLPVFLVIQVQHNALLGSS